MIANSIFVGVSLPIATFSYDILDCFLVAVLNYIKGSFTFVSCVIKLDTKILTFDKKSPDDESWSC